MLRLVLEPSSVEILTLVRVIQKADCRTHAEVKKKQLARDGIAVVF